MQTNGRNQRLLEHFIDVVTDYMEDEHAVMKALRVALLESSQKLRSEARDHVGLTLWMLTRAMDLQCSPVHVVEHCKIVDFVQQAIKPDCTNVATLTSCAAWCARERAARCLEFDTDKEEDQERARDFIFLAMQGADEQAKKSTGLTDVTWHTLITKDDCEYAFKCLQRFKCALLLQRRMESMPVADGTGKAASSAAVQTPKAPKRTAELARMTLDELASMASRVKKARANMD